MLGLKISIFSRFKIYFVLQVTCDYKFENGACVPTRVHTVVVSTQHSEKVTLTALREDVIEKVIKTVIPAKYLDENTKYHINPCGNFVIGGPMGDAGLTGRKIIVDSKFYLTISASKSSKSIHQFLIQSTFQLFSTCYAASPWLGGLWPQQSESQVSKSAKPINFQTLPLISCGVVWKRESYASLFDQLSYVAYIYSFGFFIPLTIIFSSYYKIGKTLKHQTRATNTR